MTDSKNAMTAIRGRFLDVATVCDHASLTEENIRHYEDGLLLLKNGCIEWFGDWNTGQEKIPSGCPLHCHQDKLIVPGFVDTHLHFPQADIVVLDPQSTALQTRQYQRSENLADLFFSLVMLGDERSISHTYVDGCLVHERSLNEKTFRRSYE